MPVTQNAILNSEKLAILPKRLDVLEQFFQNYFEKGKRQAAVVKIQRYGVPIFEGTYGKSTLEYGLDEDTIFPMASVTKPIIAVLILILQENGLVDISNTVSRYLPEFTGGGKEEILLWHLLTHTSGLKEEELDKEFDKYITEELGIPLLEQDATFEQWNEFDGKLREAMKIENNEKSRLNDPFYQFVIKLDMKHPPRSHMTYFNLGYNLLKEIIIEVTGESIDAYAKRVLFEPIGMKNTFWKLPKEKQAQLVGREEKAKGYRWYQTDDYYNNENGAGGLKSTTEDITLFLQMILDKGMANGNRILSPASIKHMLTNHNEGVPCDLDKKWSSWGYGWNIRVGKHDDGGVLRSANSFDHGGWGGIKALGDPEYGITFVVMSIEYEPSFVPSEQLYSPAMNILYSSFL